MPTNPTRRFFNHRRSRDEQGCTFRLTVSVNLVRLAVHPSPQLGYAPLSTATPMITSIEFSNFKAWKALGKMRLAPITGLFGANSSGKSSVLQFLLMLKQTADNPDRKLVLHLGDERSLVSLGSVADVAYAHASKPEFDFTIAWALDQEISFTDPETERTQAFVSDHLQLKSNLRTDTKGKLFVQELTYSVGDDDISLKKDGKDYKLSTTAKRFRFKRARGRQWPLPGPVRFYGFADEHRTYHQNAGFLADLELEFEKLLSNIYYLGPLREVPRRDYPWTGGDPADMGRRGENAIAAILSARQQGVKIARGKGKKQLTLEEYVAHWLKELGLIQSFRVVEIAKGARIYRVKVKKDAHSPEVLLTDVGFGVSQVLPILVLCYYVPAGSTILLEQPEIHLHPRVQSGLADVFVDAIRVRKVQLIVESHSEHFLRRLQRRIAEQAGLTDSDVALYFCDQDSEGAHLSDLKVDLFGTIKNWPENFFGDEMGEIAAITKAALKRRTSASR